MALLVEHDLVDALHTYLANPTTRVAEVDMESWLRTACRHGSTAVVRLLLRQQYPNTVAPDVEAEDADSQTAPLGREQRSTPRMLTVGPRSTAPR